jgi:hypothetical protein
MITTKTIGADSLGWHLFFRLPALIWSKLPLALVYLTVLFVTNTVFAATSNQTIAIRKPAYQTPMAALEQYAKAILLKKVAVAAFTLDWRHFGRLSLEHRTILARHYQPTEDQAFDIHGLTLVATKHDAEHFYFSFNYEEPSPTTVTIDQAKIAAMLGSLESSSQTSDIAAYIDIGLTDPSLVPSASLRNLWKSKFNYYSYDAVMLRRVNHFDAVKFATKKPALNALPSDLGEAWQLFDLAPFNRTVCDHLVSRLNPDVTKLRDFLSDHCQEICQVADKDNPLKSKKVQQNSAAIWAELDRLREGFAFDISSRPLLFVLVASAGQVEVAPLLLAPSIVSDAGQSVATPNEFSPHQLPKQDITNSDMWQLRAFLKENKMPFLAQMIKVYAQKRQLVRDKKQRGPAGRSSQIESNFGKY